MSTNKQALREAAEKATPGRVGDRIDGSGSIKYQCFGYDGSLVLQTDHKNMEYGFIGDNGDADELFFRLCVPDVVLALLDELEAAERRNAELMEKLAKLIDILDWHTIELGWGEKPITLAELIVAREGADSLSSFRAAATDKGE